MRRRSTGRASGRPLAAATATLVAGALAATCGEPVSILGDIPGIMRVVAGIPGQVGETAEAQATDSRIGDPIGVAIATDGRLYVAEELNARVISVASNGALEVVKADRFCTAANCLEEPNDAALDPEGRLVVADRLGRQVWRINPNNGAATVIAGNGEIGDAPDGTAAGAAPLRDPRGVAVDDDGTVYFTERTGHRVRFIDGSGSLRTLAGTSVDGFSGDGGPAAEAQLSAPGGLGLALGVLYVADSGNDRIRAIDLSTGTITTVAGSGVRGYTGDGVPATSAALNFPEDVTPTPDGRRIFIADTQNHRVRHVPFDTNLIETYAGTGENTFNGDLRDAGATAIGFPAGVTAGPFGFLFVSDRGNDVVWRVVLGF